jgi:hypothetical protein
VSVGEEEWYVLDDRSLTAQDRSIEELLRIIAASNLSNRSQILRRKPELDDLYQDLGIQKLSRSGKAPE